MQQPNRQWLTIKSDSFESFAWFLVEMAFALIALVATARWAIASDLRDLPVTGGLAAGGTAGVHALRRWWSGTGDATETPSLERSANGSSDR